MEIDVRDEATTPIDVIRFSACGVIEFKDGRWYISEEEYDQEFMIEKHEIDDLVKALRKLKEIY